MHKGISQPIDRHRLYAYLGAAPGAVESRHVIGLAASHSWDLDVSFVSRSVRYETSMIRRTDKVFQYPAVVLCEIEEHWNASGTLTSLY